MGDAIFLGLVLLGALFGALGGPWRRLWRIAKLLIAWVLARPLSGPVAGVLGEFGAPVVAARLLSPLFAFLLVMIVLSIGGLVFRLATRAREPAPQPDGKDGPPPEKKRSLSRNERVAGAVLGAGEGLLGALMLCWILGPLGSVSTRINSLGGESGAKAAALSAIFSDSAMARLAQKRNPLDKSEAYLTAGELACVARDKAALEELRRDVDVSSFLEEDAVRRAVETAQRNPDLVQALQDGDARYLLNSQTVADLLRDEALSKAINKHRAGLKRALQRAKERSSRQEGGGTP